MKEGKEHGRLQDVKTKRPWENPNHACTMSCSFQASSTKCETEDTDIIIIIIISRENTTPYHQYRAGMTIYTVVSNCHVPKVRSEE